MRDFTVSNRAVTLELRLFDLEQSSGQLWVERDAQPGVHEVWAEGLPGQRGVRGFAAPVPWLRLAFSRVALASFGRLGPVPAHCALLLTPGEDELRASRTGGRAALAQTELEQFLRLHPSNPRAQRLHLRALLELGMVMQARVIRTLVGSRGLGRFASSLEIHRSRA